MYLRSFCFKLPTSSIRYSKLHTIAWSNSCDHGQTRLAECVKLFCLPAGEPNKFSPATWRAQRITSHQQKQNCQRVTWGTRQPTQWIMWSCGHKINIRPLYFELLSDDIILHSDFKLRMFMYLWYIVNISDGHSLVVMTSLPSV